MCGILGIYNLSSSVKFDRDRFISSLLTMHHRGPDSNQIKVFGNKAILGHVRLSIIDVSEENTQPFQVDGRYWIVYNGEIYNYIELRDELINAGYTFRTTGDTEVILRAYQHWGRECISRFNGMWAFAIFDEADHTLFCSRDRFGIKPFYYALVNKVFIFSSEIKGILSYFPSLKKPNYNVISNYCRKSIGAQLKETWFLNIFRLEPAHNLMINTDSIKSERYWDYPRKINSEITFEEAKLRYQAILSDAIKIRMRSDVPVGFTLSSGIDSSSIVCLLKNQFSGNKNTYTADFSSTTFHRSEKQNFRHDISINEPEIVKRLTSNLDLNSHVIQINYSSYVDELRKIIWHLESGHGSPAIFPLSQILQEAKKDVTVVLEGQGADELLGGYIIDVFPLYLFSLVKKLQIIKARKELSAFLKIYSPILAIMLLIRQSNMRLLKRLYYRISGMELFFKGALQNFEELNDYPINPVGFDDLINTHLYKSHTGCLVDLLHYGDAIPMSHSMESRLPFMDYRLVEFVFSLPGGYKLNSGKGKYLHREALRNIVPGEIINNPIKLGFDSPLSELFKNEGENSAESILLSKECISRGIFSEGALKKAFREQKDGTKDRSRLLFRLLNVELWFRQFID